MNQPAQRHGDRIKSMAFARSVNFRQSSWVPPAVPAGLPFNVAQVYMRMAEGPREGKSVSPDFDMAVRRNQLLDVIQKASDTGIRQIF